MIVYVSIGNSDDKLTQVLWASFAGQVRGAVKRAATEIHGDWASLPYSSFQNACWCAEVESSKVHQLQLELIGIADMYRQDSIAWAEAPHTEFLGGAA